jgi:hypothetical protein
MDAKTQIVVQTASADVLFQEFSSSLSRHVPQDKTRQDKTRQDKTRQDKTVCQPTVALSSTKAEFAMTADSGKAARCLHSVLHSGKTRCQPAAAFSSTEAEFSTAADSGRNCTVLLLCSHELGVEKRLPTVTFEDNDGAQLMTNPNNLPEAPVAC